MQLLSTTYTSLRSGRRASVEHVLELKLTASEVLQTSFAKIKEELSDGVTGKLSNQEKMFLVESEPRIHAVGASFSKVKVKRFNLRSSTVKRAMLLTAISPPKKGNCWLS